VLFTRDLRVRDTRPSPPRGSRRTSWFPCRHGRQADVRGQVRQPGLCG